MSRKMKKVFKLFEDEEKVLSPERIAEIDRAGETVGQFINEHSSEEINYYLESLPDQERITIIAAGLWNCYRFRKEVSI